MGQKLISIIGSLNTDLITRTSRVPLPGETLTAESFSTGSGGKGANQAAACARLSRHRQSPSDGMVTVQMVGAVGADIFGRDLVADLGQNGIDTSRVRITEGEKTGVAVIVVEEATGENRIMLTPGANYSLTPDQFDHLSTPLPAIIVLQLEIPLDTVIRIVHTAKLQKVPVLLNPAPAVRLPKDVYRGLAHLVVNETEAEILTKGQMPAGSIKDNLSVACDIFHHLGVINVIITLGGDGVFYSSSERRERVSSSPIKKISDTTAAGDTFVGAYAVCIVQGQSIPESVHWANIAAAKTVEKEGAQDAIPWLDDMPAL
ncbi:MAG: hypothetical protein LQ351_005334 [Letrouitia transgressa]|nr:MAG: hypothetical protein LQ351_005334 [Letrouitia transgressa]